MDARQFARQRVRDTSPELALRRELHSRGLRYRVHLRFESRRVVDIAFIRPKVAVFVDGCFWHRCQTHKNYPSTNSDFWRLKLDSNVERDRDTDRRLREAGWVVIRVWEHEDPVEAADRIEETVRERTRVKTRFGVSQPTLTAKRG